MNPKRQSKTSPVPARQSLSGGQLHPGRDENGFIIIAVIALVAILALVGTVAVMTTTTEIKISSNYKTRTQAFYIAEAGVHRAIGMLNDATTDWINLIDANDAFFGDNDFGKGTYKVTISEDDPTLGSVLITSTGSASTSSSTVETVVTKQYYDVLLNYAMFDCGTIALKGGVTNTISGGDVYVNGTLDLEPAGGGINIIKDGDAYARGDIVIGDNSYIENGDAFANGNIDLEDSASINGNATTGVGGVVSDHDKVSGTTTEGVSDPVPDLCSGTNLADITMPSEDIQDLKDNANIKITENYTFNSVDDYTGIVHITGDFTLEDDATFSDNVIFIVDGNVEIKGSLTSDPPGASVTFIVPNSDFEVTGGGSVTIDGVLLVGTINEDGNDISDFHSIDVKDGSNLTVNGTVIAVNGNTDAMDGGELTVNYESPNDSNLMEPNSYKMTQWREIRN